MIVSLTRQILFLLPLILILPLIMGIDGVMYAGPIADLAAAVITIWFVLRQFQDMKKKEAARDNKEEATELKNEKTTPVISPELADLPVEAIVEKEISDNTIENNAEALSAPAPKKRGRKSKAEKAALEAAAKLAEEQATVLSDKAKQLPVMDEPITDVPLEILQDIPAQSAETIDDVTEAEVPEITEKQNLWHLLQKFLLCRRK